MDVKRIIKDALILCAITLIAGLALGATHEVTAPIIADVREAKAQATYKEVYPEAVSFEERDSVPNVISVSKLAIANQGFGDVSIDDCLLAKDAEGKTIGFLVTATSNEGYGGAVQISVGIDRETRALTGVGFLTLNETAGLGMKAKEPLFRDQFPGKKADRFSVVKSGTAGNSEIQAISGATRTSKAVTGAINAAVYFINNCFELDD
ncbi:MAG: FMN-binding protein [Lachnospiraceae bacterium]|nr:FMN-binding protein [Lachnospiraceae bacterium]